MLFSALSAALETAFNTWLALDAQTYGTARSRLQSLHGKLICLHITNPDLRLYFMPTAERILVSDAYAAEPDVTIHGSALALMRLAKAEDSGKATLENRIQIDGDMGLGNRFSQILREIDVDWEELLSRAVGDVIAHQMGQLARTGKSWVDDSAHAMRLNTKEYLQEESHLIPADAEVRRYLDEVDNLRMATDRLEARLKQLETNEKHTRFDS